MSERGEPFGVSEYLEQEETNRPQELLWGVVRDAASPTPRHQEAVFDFAYAWRFYAATGRAGSVIIAPMDCVFDRERALILQPDVVFISQARLHLVTDRVWGAPDIVLEVLSPHPRIGTLQERLALFAEYGVKECWLYHQPERALEIVSFSGGVETSRRRFEYDDRIVSPLWPEFDRSCADILKPLF
jgi:Uma2 family endonuclease